MTDNAEQNPNWKIVPAAISEAELMELFVPAVARGRPTKVGEPVTLQIVRGLGPSDIDAIVATTESDAPFTLAKITSAHHEVARMLAKGEARHMVALHSGYTPEYVSKLQTDPTFMELVEYYSTQHGAEFVEVSKRMATVGMLALDELQERITDKPEELTTPALLDIAETLLVKPAKAASGAGTPGVGAGGVLINIGFQMPTQTAAGPVIDAKAEQK